ncbi:hypothetical protein K488DRAFT_80062 [Vararia minispora EC-137]|uniref:Uncharacterized protein n=1 Tax=Vararia minispora EC-137 TaxID=1314806 RepID=A0ACB8QDH7_9AGAM|nr:hypothetical protein K488DRAFT_80062 [Vararia minispora EC-137]
MAKTWLITGANRGIGLELVRQLALDAANTVVACCRNPNTASGLGDLVASAQGRIHVIPLDVGDPASISSSVSLAKPALEEHGLDYLINNAAINHGMDNVLEDMSSEILMRTFQVNVIGPALMAQAYLPFLEKPGVRGVIMNMTSGLASIGLDFEKCPSYSISKAAVNMLTTKQSRARKNLIPFVIDPGWVKTEMGGPGAELEPAESVEGMLKLLKNADSSYAGKFFRYDGSTLPW